MNSAPPAPRSALEKPRYPRASALAVVRELLDVLRPHCPAHRLIVAGSLRRRKDTVGDIELVYISRTEETREGLFDVKHTALVDCALARLLHSGALQMRRTRTGACTWGQRNKLALHVASGIPVDFFSITEESWFNYLVCRTGGAQNNVAIATAARDRGWIWHPYGAGFTDEHGRPVPVASEREVFEHVRLPYLEPWERL